MPFRSSLQANRAIIPDAPQTIGCSNSATRDERGFDMARKRSLTSQLYRAARLSAGIAAALLAAASVAVAIPPARRSGMSKPNDNVFAGPACAGRAETRHCHPWRDEGLGRLVSLCAQTFGAVRAVSRRALVSSRCSTLW